MTPEQKTTAGKTTFAGLISLTLIIAAVALALGLYLRFAEGVTAYTGVAIAFRNGAASFVPCDGPAFGCTIAGHNAQWTTGTAMVEWSITYLVLVGVPYGLIRLLGGGRLRRAIRTFWQGDER